MVNLKEQLEKLSLKDGDILIWRTDNPDYSAVDSLFENLITIPNPPNVFLWVLGLNESLEVITDSDKETLRKALDG